MNLVEAELLDGRLRFGEHALPLAEMSLDVGAEVAVHDVAQLLRALELEPENATAREYREKAKRALG